MATFVNNLREGIYEINRILNYESAQYIYQLVMQKLNTTMHRYVVMFYPTRMVRYHLAIVWLTLYKLWIGMLSFVSVRSVVSQRLSHIIEPAATEANE